MTTAVQRRRGTTTEHSTFTGLEGEISINTTKNTVVVHDGSTVSGFELARADGTNTDYATAAQGVLADAALPKTGGALTGAITTNSTIDGRDVAVDGAKLDGVNQGVGTSDSPAFSDLTLSGGVYLGGSGAANKLDDFEKGNWTPIFGGTAINPTVSFSSTGPAEYVKVGSVVTASMAFFGNITAAGSGVASIQGLPFQAKGSRGVASINYNSATSNPTTGVAGYIEDNTTICYLYQGGSNTGESWAAGTNQRLFFTITYIVD